MGMFENSLLLFNVLTKLAVDKDAVYDDDENYESINLYCDLSHLKVYVDPVRIKGRPEVYARCELLKKLDEKDEQFEGIQKSDITPFKLVSVLNHAYPALRNVTIWKKPKHMKFYEPRRGLEEFSMV